MIRFKAWKAGIAVAVAVALQGCGGGGGGAEPASDAASSAVKPSSVEKIATSVEPTGGLLIENLLPRNVGDTLTYEVLDGQGLPTGVQEVETVSSLLGETLTIQTARSDGSLSDTSIYTYNAAGITDHISFFEEFDAQVTPRIDNIVLYPKVLPPAGQVRSVVRQGDLGQDLDEDGINDAYRFEFKQVLVGEEIRSTALSRTPLKVYHLQTTVTHTLLFSQADVQPFTRSIVAHDYLLPGVGIVHSDNTLSSSNPAESRQINIDLKRAQIGSQTVGPITQQKLTIEVPVKVTELVHAPSRQWFLGVVASTGGAHDNAIVAIEASTGKILGYSSNLPAQVRSIKAAPSADVAYVTQETGEIVRFSLVPQSSTPLVESARMQMPTPTDFPNLIYVPLDLAVSPVDPGVLAVAASRQGSFTSDVFLIRNMGVVDQAAGVDASKLAFSSDGKRLVTVNRSNSDVKSISLFGVNADRLGALTSIVHSFPTSPVTMDAFDDQVLINDETFSVNDLAAGPAFNDICRLSSYQGRPARECQLTLSAIDSTFDLVNFSLTDASVAFAYVVPGTGGASARWLQGTHVFVLVNKP